MDMNTNHNHNQGADMPSTYTITEPAKDGDLFAATYDYLASTHETMADAVRWIQDQEAKQEWRETEGPKVTAQFVNGTLTYSEWAQAWDGFGPTL